MQSECFPCRAAHLWCTESVTSKLHALSITPICCMFLRSFSRAPHYVRPQANTPEKRLQRAPGRRSGHLPCPRRRAAPRAQVKKEEEELQRAFGASGVAVMGVQKPGAPRPGATAADLAEGEKKMVTVMLFGNAHECEVAQRMIGEAIDNKARACPSPCPKALIGRALVSGKPVSVGMLHTCCVAAEARRATATAVDGRSRSDPVRLRTASGELRSRDQQQWCPLHHAKPLQASNFQAMAQEGLSMQPDGQTRERGHASGGGVRRSKRRSSGTRSTRRSGRPRRATGRCTSCATRATTRRWSCPSAPRAPTSRPPTASWPRRAAARPWPGFEHGSGGGSSSR